MRPHLMTIGLPHFSQTSLGGLLLALHVAHLDLGLLEVELERRVEAVQQLDPVGRAVLDLVELLFHLRREVGADDAGEALHQQAVRP